MNVHYIILASKNSLFNANVIASLACGFDSDPRDDYYFASTKIKECLMQHHIAKGGSITFDVDFYNTTAHGRGPFLITAIFDCKSETFYVIPEPWSYVEDVIERCTSIDLNHTAIGYEFFDEFEKNLKDMSADELNKLIPEFLNVQTRVSEFYGHLMLADKTGYFLPERYQNNLYWRLPMSISGTITFKFKEEKNEIYNV